MLWKVPFLGLAGQLLEGVLSWAVRGDLNFRRGATLFFFLALLKRLVRRIFPACTSQSPCWFQVGPGGKEYQWIHAWHVHCRSDVGELAVCVIYCAWAFNLPPLACLGLSFCLKWLCCFHLLWLMSLYAPISRNGFILTFAKYWIFFPFQFCYYLFNCLVLKVAICTPILHRLWSAEAFRMVLGSQEGASFCCCGNKSALSLDWVFTDRC